MPTATDVLAKERITLDRMAKDLSERETKIIASAQADAEQSVAYDREEITKRLAVVSAREDAATKREGAITSREHAAASSEASSRKRHDHASQRETVLTERESLMARHEKDIHFARKDVSDAQASHRVASDSREHVILEAHERQEKSAAEANVKLQGREQAVSKREGDVTRREIQCAEIEDTLSKGLLALSTESATVSESRTALEHVASAQTQAIVLRESSVAQRESSVDSREQAVDAISASLNHRKAGIEKGLLDLAIAKGKVEKRERFVNALIEQHQLQEELKVLEP